MIVATFLAAAVTAVKPLKQAQLKHLHHSRYVVVPNWLSNVQTANLQADALAVDKHSGIDCTVGTKQFNTVVLDRGVRNSRVCALYPPPSNAVGCVDARAGLIDAVNGLRNELQLSDLMGLPHLEAFETELHYLLYPVNGHYIRHLDQPKANDGWTRQGRTAVDGGSFSGGQTRRVVSFLIYLNTNWDAADGGALRIFPAHEHLSHAEHATQPSNHVEDVLPEGGTLVLFMSGDVEHLVRVTARERQCVVGWFREYREVRVPDLDAMSLRTHQLLSKTATSDACAGRAKASGT